MLGVQMGFRLFYQEKRHLLRVRLQKEQLGCHEKQVVVAEPPCGPFNVAGRCVQIQFEAFENLIK